MDVLMHLLGKIWFSTPNSIFFFFGLYSIITLSIFRYKQKGEHSEIMHHRVILIVHEWGI